MSTGHTERDPRGAAGPATEEELRAAYEAEIKKIRVDQVLLENIVSLINLGMRRTGMAPGTEDERDLGQVQLAIESIRALLPIVEQSSAPQAGPIRDALSQLQLAFVRLGGAASGAPAGARLRAREATGRPRRRARPRSRGRRARPDRRSRALPSLASPVPPSAAGACGCPDNSPATSPKAVAERRVDRRSGRRHARLARGLCQGPRTIAGPFAVVDRRATAP